MKRDPSGRVDEAGTSRFRADIEGLRAVAVVLVVVNHLTGRPSGGFVGVDVFFVISGFLITGLLLHDTDRRGRLSFRRFYLRRARRILPAALTVLAASVVAAHLVFRGARIAQTTHDAGWAAGFAANIHFAAIGTDYFQADRAPSLVQHYWSLAVEEQFYLVWPVVIVVIMSVIGRRASRAWARPLLLAVLVALTVGSFVLSLVQTHANPTAAYFSSPDRAWELGVGAIIAVAARPCQRAARRIGTARGPIWLLGLAAIITSAFVVHPSSGFPAPSAAFPVLATGVVIIAGMGQPLGAWGSPLTNPATRYLGRISYSLYLWHWPVIILTAALLPHDPAYRYAIAVLASLGLSVAGYHLIEAPCRRLGSRGKQRRTGPRRGRVRPVVAAVCCLAVAATLAAAAPTPSPPRFDAARPVGLLPLPRHDVLKPPAHLAAAIEKSLAARRFPGLTPPLSQQGSARSHWGQCDMPTANEATQCVYGSSAPSAPVAVVLGDSIAMSWLPGIVAALGTGWRVVGLTLEACPAADIAVVDVNRNYHTACDTHHAWAVRKAIALHPRVVLLSSADDTLNRLADKATGARAATEYETALTQTIDRLRTATRHIVTLSAPPMSSALSKCDTVGRTPADCVRPISNQWVSLARAQAVVANTTHTTYADTRRWFCNTAGYCPAFIGTTAVRWDTEHLTGAYARSLAPALRRLIRGQLMMCSTPARCHCEGETSSENQDESDDACGQDGSGNTRSR